MPRAKELLDREDWGMLVDGELVRRSEGEPTRLIAVTVDGSPRPLAQPADADRAVAAAKAALGEWRATGGRTSGPPQRGITVLKPTRGATGSSTR
jgi:hypothetical protein